MTRRSIARSCIKSLSWGFVSFFVIGAFEVAAIAWREGWESVAMVAPGLAIGLAASCVGKVPFHLGHDYAWNRLFSRRDAGRLRDAVLRDEAPHGPACDPGEFEANRIAGAYPEPSWDELLAALKGGYAVSVTSGCGATPSDSPAAPPLSVDTASVAC